MTTIDENERRSNSDTNKADRSSDRSFITKQQEQQEEDEEPPPLVYATVEATAPTEVLVASASTVVSSTSASAPVSAVSAIDAWSCPRCTLLNPNRKLYCIACFQRHPDLAANHLNYNCHHRASDPENDEDDDANHNSNEDCYNNDHVNPTATQHQYILAADVAGILNGNDNNNNGIVVESFNSQHDVASRVVVRDAPYAAAAVEDDDVDAAEEAPGHKKKRRRRRRKQRMMVCGTVGATAGAVLFGIGGGAVLGSALAGGLVARIVSKQKERAKDARVRHERREREATDEDKNRIMG